MKEECTTQSIWPYCSALMIICDLNYGTVGQRREVFQPNSEDVWNCLKGNYSMLPPSCVCNYSVHQLMGPVQRQ